MPEPREDRIVSNAVHASFGLWFPLFRRLARHVPPEWFARLSAATVERVIWEREPVREAILDNFSRVLSLPRNDPRVEETARAMIAAHSRLWIDLLRYSGRKDFDPASLLASRIGEGRLVEAQREGKGTILLTAHVGNFELGGLFLKQLGLDVYAVYAPDPSPAVEAQREKARRMLGVKGIPVTSSPFAFVPILRALRENACVAMQGDRDVSGTGKRLPFFGESASFPVGPFRLAARSGAPLFPVFVLQEPDGRYRTVVEEAIRVPDPKEPEAKERAIDDAMERFVATMSRTIRENPAQWYLFTRFWNGTG